MPKQQSSKQLTKKLIKSNKQLGLKLRSNDILCTKLDVKQHMLINNLRELRWEQLFKKKEFEDKLKQEKNFTKSQLDQNDAKMTAENKDKPIRYINKFDTWLEEDIDSFVDHITVESTKEICIDRRELVRDLEKQIKNLDLRSENIFKVQKKRRAMEKFRGKLIDMNQKAQNSLYQSKSCKDYDEFIEASHQANDKILQVYNDNQRELLMEDVQNSMKYANIYDNLFSDSSDSDSECPQLVEIQTFANNQHNEYEPVATNPPQTYTRIYNGESDSEAELTDD